MGRKVPFIGDRLIIFSGGYAAMKEKLKLIKNLLEKRSARRKEKLFMVEGPHLVEEAGERIKFVIHTANLPLIKELEKKGIPCYKISPEQFAELSGVETP